MAKKRMQITVGPEWQKLLKKLAVRYAKESGTEYSSVDVLEGAAMQGLRERLKRFAMEHDAPLSLRK